MVSALLSKTLQYPIFTNSSNSIQTSNSNIFPTFAPVKMKKQSTHIKANLCESPSIEGLFGYDHVMWNEARAANFGNYLL